MSTATAAAHHGPSTTSSKPGAGSTQAASAAADSKSTTATGSPASSVEHPAPTTSSSTAQSTTSGASKPATSTASSGASSSTASTASAATKGPNPAGTSTSTTSTPATSSAAADKASDDKAGASSASPAESNTSAGLAASPSQAVPTSFDPSKHHAIVEKLLAAKGSKAQKQVLLREDEIRQVLNDVRDVFMSQDVLLEITPPIKICGDIHGQFYDLLRIFDKCGFPPQANYLFLGDYVDRGKHSVETIILLFCYKCLYRETFFLLRGNHECAAINKMYGFFDDVKRRYNIRLFKQFTDVFNTMPVACCISDKILCMHGGLSPDLQNLQSIRNLSRPCDVPDRGLLCDLLWADPEEEVKGYVVSDRGVSYLFGEDVVSEFLDDVDMDLVVRAHQVMEKGYGFFAARQLVTLFSAPSYCGEFDNDAAIMNIDEKLQCSFLIVYAKS